MKNIIGKQGEEMAVDYLMNLGYKIKQRNFRSRFGEIDIIAYDVNNKNTVFIEVRTKTTPDFGTAEESITKTKKTRLLKTAFFYLANYPTESFRFDLIAINLFLKKPINHYKNIIGT